MQSPIQNQHKQFGSENEDQSAKLLFDQISLPEENPFGNQSNINVQQSNSVSQDQAKENIFNLKKSKKEKKKQKRNKKLMALKKKNRKQNIDTNIQQKRHKKMTFQSSEDEKQLKNQGQKIQKAKVVDQSEKQNSQVESNQFSSEHLSSSQSQGLANLNPNNQNQQEEGHHRVKKLGSSRKKSRKLRIMQKQGFDLRQLGNDADLNFQLNQSVNQSDDSYSEDGKTKRHKGLKKSNKKKDKKQKVTNEQFLKNLHQLGCQQQQSNNNSAAYNYDSGIDQVHRIKSKKQNKNTIKFQNRMFGDLQIELEKQINQQDDQAQQGEVPTQKLQLEFKPRASSALSKSNSFLSKVENIKKSRGIQANINEEQFDKMMKQKAKRSISQLVQRINQDIQGNEQIDIQIKAPTITKGKSADLINNTMFIRSLNQKIHSTNNIPNLQASQSQKTEKNLIENKSVLINKSEAQKNVSLYNVKSSKSKDVSRNDFFKQIRQSIQQRRSKHVTSEELKNSFKSSKLEELQQIRKKIQEKRKKQALLQFGQVQDDDADNLIKQLQEQLARKGGMTREQLKKLLTAEQALDGLGQYEEQQQKKKNKKKNTQQNTQQNQNRQAIQNQKQQEKINVQRSLNSQQIKTDRQNLLLNKKDLLQKLKKLQQLQKAKRIQLDEQKYHEDDMVQQYQGQVLLSNQQDIDIQNIEENQQNNNEMEQQSASNQSDQNQDEDNDQDYQNDIVNVGNVKEKYIQDQLKAEQNYLLKKELQEQGIIMPGANYKKKHHQSNIQFNGYIIETQNTPEKVIISTQANIQIEDKNSNTFQKKGQKMVISEQNAVQFKQFRKLRKFATVLKQKRKRRQEQLQRAKAYFQQQAELGSDNEQNDDNIKHISKRQDQQQQDGQDLDQQLEQLIDNAVDLNEENQNQAFRKYMQQQRQKDRQQLQKIMRGEFRTKRDGFMQQEMEDDQRDRLERMDKMMQWMKNKEQEDGNMYVEEQQDDENDYYYDYDGNRKKITKKIVQEQGQEQAQQEDPEVMAKKLQDYLQDNVSPAKIDVQTTIHTQFIRQLPMVKKSKPLFGLTFGGKGFLSGSTIESKVPNQIVTKTISSFTGSLLNLTGTKTDNNILGMARLKKNHSHLSQQFKKSKSQKPKAFEGTLNKLPAIFSRAGLKK